MKKLRAFTLMELLVGMIVSAIVISFGYGAFGLITRQFASYKQVRMQLMEVTQFRAVFANDLFEADEVYCQEKQLFLKGKSALIYTIHDSIISRSIRDQTDTFHLAVNDLRLTHVEEEENALVCGIRFNTQLNNEEQYFSFVRNYDAVTLMKAERREE